MKRLNRANLAAANYDVGFGVGGIATVNLGGTTQVNKVLAQSDGSTLVAGSVGSDAFIARLTVGGALDPSFGTAGVRRIDLGGTEAFNDMLVLSDGDIVAGGNAGASQYVLVRLNSDGTIDSGFGGGDGIVTGTGQIASIATNGTVFFSAGGDAVRKQSLTTGAIDTTFGTAGTASVSGVTKLVSFSDDDLVVRSDGRPLLIGEGDLASVPAQGDEDFFPNAETPAGTFLVSLTTSGAVDNTFDTDGVQPLYLSDGEAGSRDGLVSLDSSGNIFTLFGIESHGGSIVLSRYNPADGQQVWSQSQNIDLSGVVTRLSLTSDGIVIGLPSGLFYRYDTSGNVDSTFNGDGSIQVPLNAEDDDLGPAAWTADGKLVVVEQADAGFMLSRILSHANTITDNVHVNSRGTLLIYGTQLADTIGVRLVGHRIRVSTATESLSFSVNVVKRITANLYDGNDLLKVYAAIDQPLTADSGAGMNIIAGGSGSDSILGGDGDDQLFGGDGNDTIIAGDGSDSVDGGAGADVLSGGAGAFDTLSFNGDNAVSLTPDGVANDGAVNEHDNIDDSFEIITGTAGNDYLVTNNSTGAAINGMGGDDTIFGGPGPDGLYGGDGRDHLYGGGGADRLEGGGGSDWLHADGDGVKDTLVGGHDPQDRLYKDDIDVVN